MEEINAFFKALENSITKDNFVKITLSKPAKKQDGLKNVYVRLITLKGEKKLSFTYHYKTNDQVKNYTLKEAQEKIEAIFEAKLKYKPNSSIVKINFKKRRGKIYVFAI